MIDTNDHLSLANQSETRIYFTRATVWCMCVCGRQDTMPKGTAKEGEKNKRGSGAHFAHSVAG